MICKINIIVMKMMVISIVTIIMIDDCSDNSNGYDNGDGN